MKTKAIQIISQFLFWVIVATLAVCTCIGLIASAITLINQVKAL